VGDLQIVFLKLHKYTKTGFTLIEILIVVAIIGILSAIAVPNFLLAQTRAKVSRAKADLYSVALALEEYRIDETGFPPARTFCAGMMSSINDYNMSPVELTSPVDYISACPLDVFNPDCTYKYVKAGIGWANNSLTILPVWVQEGYPDNDMGYASDVPYFIENKSPVKWALWSVGPYGPLPFYESDYAHVPVPYRTWYDPTNGTISSGIITRLSTGRYSY
jgi:type II secretion system protein G